MNHYEATKTALFIYSTAAEVMLQELTKDAYQKGVEGVKGYPLDINAEIVDLESFVNRKIHPMGYKVIANLIEKLDQAYERGRESELYTPGECVHL